MPKSDLAQGRRARPECLAGTVSVGNPIRLDVTLLLPMLSGKHHRDRPMTRADLIKERIQEIEVELSNLKPRQRYQSLDGLLAESRATPLWSAGHAKLFEERRRLELEYETLPQH
jgi:hypothetical protein